MTLIIQLLISEKQLFLVHGTRWNLSHLHAMSTCRQIRQLIGFILERINLNSWPSRVNAGPGVIQPNFRMTFFSQFTSKISIYPDRFSSHLIFGYLHLILYISILQPNFTMTFFTFYFYIYFIDATGLPGRIPHNRAPGQHTP